MLRSVSPIGLHSCVEHFFRPKRSCFHLCTKLGTHRSTVSSCIWRKCAPVFLSTREKERCFVNILVSVNRLNACVRWLCCQSLLCSIQPLSSRYHLDLHTHHLLLQQSQLVSHLEHSQSEGSRTKLNNETVCSATLHILYVVVSFK